MGRRSDSATSLQAPPEVLIFSEIRAFVLAVIRAPIGFEAQPQQFV